MVTRYQYKYLGGELANEACFIGEMWVTLASRDLAEYYVDVLREDVRINGNSAPIEVMWAGYMLSGKDLGHGVHKARVDRRVWDFPTQFHEDGRFLTNGPGCLETERSEFNID